MYICFISSGTSTQHGSSMNFVRGAGENLCFFDSFDTAESRGDHLSSDSFFFPLCTISHKNCRRERKPAGQKHTWQPQTFSPCMHVGYHEGLARRGQCHDHVDLVQKLYPPSERFPGSKSRRTVRCSFLLFNYYHFFFIRI